MKTAVQVVIKIVILICIVAGVALIVRNTSERQEEKAQREEVVANPKAAMLKKYLLGFNKPARVEIVNLTEKFTADVEEIKKMKLPLNAKSEFYIRIQFFTDESDETAPLVAQIRFLDIKSDNLVKEESINLD